MGQQMTSMKRAAPNSVEEGHQRGVAIHAGGPTSLQPYSKAPHRYRHQACHHPRRNTRCAADSAAGEGVPYHPPFLKTYQHHGWYATNKELRRRSQHTSLTAYNNNSTAYSVAMNATVKKLPFWPRFDSFDRRIASLLGPAMLNFLLVPIAGLLNTYFVGKLGNAELLAAVGAGNELYNSMFFFLAFLPSVITPLVAQSAAANDFKALQANVSQAMWLGTTIGFLGMGVINGASDTLLSLVGIHQGDARFAPARQYVLIRAISLIPALLSTIGLATYRGRQDTVTPLKISVAAQFIQILLVPLLVFKVGLGITGAAAATSISVMASAMAYMVLLFNDRLVSLTKFLKPPDWKSLRKLLSGGSAIVLKTAIIRILFMRFTALAQGFGGVDAAAHTIAVQFWSLTGNILFALASVATVIVSRELAKGRWQARYAAERCMAWSALVGMCMSVLQLSMLPLLGLFTPIPEVQQAAQGPAIIGAFLQLTNGPVFVAEGIMQSTSSFFKLARLNFVGMAAMWVSLGILATPENMGLNGVWASFFVFNIVRLSGFAFHHFFDGPLAPRKIGPEPRHDGTS